MDLDALKSPASPRRQRELGHLLRFAVVGCLSVAMDLAVFRALRAHGLMFLWTVTAARLPGWRG